MLVRAHNGVWATKFEHCRTSAACGAAQLVWLYLGCQDEPGREAGCVGAHYGANGGRNGVPALNPEDYPPQNGSVASQFSLGQRFKASGSESER